MKTLCIISILVFSIFIVGCDNRYDDGYKNGYENGESQGVSKGEVAGYERGLSEGYNKGYADASNNNEKDLTIVDSKIRGSIRVSLKIFTLLFYGINIISLLAIIAYLVAKRHTDIIYIIAKCLFLLMSVAVSYLVISATNFGYLVNPDYSHAVKWLVISVIFPITFGICFASRRILIKYDVIYSDIMAIILSTSALVFFSFFLLDINVFILMNEFISYCVISVSAGGLGFSGYTLISERLTTTQQSA
ncbi:MAG: hypothetical protein PHH28_15450 [Desulfuromonadaceae bacterium]|nr:hypothetical protein [Desulfuromonadaceae bacterium]